MPVNTTNTRYRREAPEGLNEQPLGDISGSGLKVPRNQMAFYAKRVGPKLRALLEEANQERRGYEVTEELDLARGIVAHEVMVLSQLMETDDKCFEGGYEAKEQLLAVARANVLSGMERIVALVEKASRIVANAANRCSPHVIEEVTKQIMRFAHISFAEYPGAIEKFDNFLTNELELPSIKSLGTKITPDMQVAAMDSTVPFVADE